MRILLRFLLLVCLAVAAQAQTGINVGVVEPNPDHLLITPANPTIPVNLNGTAGTVQMSATLIMADASLGGQSGSLTLQCGTNWNSTSAAVATVDQNGLVTAVSAGSTTISCTLPNSNCANGNPCTGSTTLTVQPGPNFTNPAACGTPPCLLPQGFGPPSAVAYSFTFTGSGGVLPYTWSISAGSLPGWASLNSSTGTLSGTPNAVGVSVFTVQLCDNVSACNTLQVSLTVVVHASSGAGPPQYGNSTTSLLSQNLVAGCNATVPAALCGTVATTYSVTSNAITLNVPNSFKNGSVIGVSGCTGATFLNGDYIVANSSTNATKVVGAWFNTHNVAQTHANTSGTDATCYLQGQGWQPWVTAPFPAVGSANCPNGNGSVGCVGTLTSADIGTWALANDTPSGALDTLNKNCSVMLANVTTGIGANPKKDYNPSRSGETNDNLVSLDDGASGYFFGLVTGGAIYASHGHIASNYCGTGISGFVPDVTTQANMWNSGGHGGPSFGTRPGVNQALWYAVDTSDNYHPLLKKYVLTYAAAGCAGQPCVTADAGTTVYDITACPGWKFTTIGSGLTTITNFGRNTADTDFFFGLGSGGQGNVGWHMLFHINTTRNSCETQDTESFTSTEIYSAQVNKNNKGTNYRAGDAVTITNGTCQDTFQISQVNASGGATFIVLIDGACSGWNLQQGYVASGGSGTGLQIDVTGLGIPTDGCCGSVWAPGSSSPQSTGVNTYGLHSGNMDRSGTYVFTSGLGTAGEACSGCDGTTWTLNSSKVQAKNITIQNGHPAQGYKYQGIAKNPNYYKNFGGDPSCVTSTNCVVLFTYSCNGAGTQMHSAIPVPLNDMSYPFLITSSVNSPAQTTTNPPNWSCELGQSFWALDQTGVTRWFGRNYTNSTNTGISFDAMYGIFSIAQDGKFLIYTNDCLAGFAGNVGCDKDNNGLPQTPDFSMMLN